MAIIRKDISGNRYGWLQVLFPAGYQGRGRIAWSCQCNCGSIVIARADHLKSGGIKSCGCRKRQRALRGEPRFLHGMTNTPEHDAFLNAKQRCNDPNAGGYKNYGGRGIEFRFKSFEEFYSEVGSKPTPKHSIDRINNDGHYEPGNVRWTDRSTQMRNRRPFRRHRQ